MMLNRRRTAVTLLELLVAIGLVVMLMALLLPAILKARDAARNRECQNNLRQIALAFRLFADLHGDRFPNTETSSEPWFVHVEPHLEMHESIFYCPANPVEEDFSYDWRDDVALLPGARLSGKKFSSLAKTELVLVVDRSPGWHSAGTVNVGMINGSVKMLTEDELEENLVLNARTGEFSFE